MAKLLSDVVGEELVRWRKYLGVTRDQVAEKCAAWGWPALTAAALGNIETGRRDSTGRRRREVTIDEIVVLAWVLEVPLLSLVAPFGHKPTVEMLPGLELNTVNVLAWLRGDRSMSNTAEYPVWPALRLYVKVDYLAVELYSILGQWGPERQPAPDDHEAAGAVTVQDRPPGWDQMFQSMLAVLRQDREQLRALGYPCPPLPAGLEWIDPPRREDQPTPPRVDGGA